MSNPVIYCGYCCVMCKTYFDRESDLIMMHQDLYKYDSLSKKIEQLVLIPGV